MKKRKKKKEKTITDIILHWYYVNKTFLKYYGFKNWLKSSCYKHDLDKVLKVIMCNYNKKEHKEKSNHHYEFITEKSNISDIREMICDWESSRYSKPDKPLSAKQFHEVVYDKIPNWLNRKIEVELERVV